MTREESIRLAQLETEVTTIGNDLKEVKADTKEIRARFNKLEGGKLALLWLLGFIGSAAYGLYRFFSSH